MNPPPVTTTPSGPEDPVAAGPEPAAAGPGATGPRAVVPWRAALTLALLWVVLTGGAPASWVLGLPAVLAATWAAHRLGATAGPGISLVGTGRFIPFFLWESLRGGADVAVRVFRPTLPVAPGFVVYETRLHSQGARVFFATCLSLLPGTLAADLQGPRLEVHLLDTGSDATAELGRLEAAVGRVFRDPGMGS